MNALHCLTPNIPILIEIGSAKCRAMQSQSLLPSVIIRFFSLKRNLMVDFPSGFLLKTIMHRSFEKGVSFAQHSNALDRCNSFFKHIRNRYHINAAGVTIAVPIRIEVKISIES